jgi:hypothetical protein
VSGADIEDRRAENLFVANGSSSVAVVPDGCSNRRVEALLV